MLPVNMSLFLAVLEQFTNSAAHDCTATFQFENVEEVRYALNKCLECNGDVQFKVIGHRVTIRGVL